MNQALSTTNVGRNRIIDLRSDTVTQPSAGMRKAMAEAEVGDDVYGEDPTVTALEERVSDLFGKEDAVFMATGTQSNLAALLCHCGRGEEFIVGDSYHAFKYEAGGASALGGIVACPLRPDESGGLRPGDIAAAVKPDDSHFPITRLLSLENTVSGQVQSLESIDAACAVARTHGLSLHLDGARVWNAAAALKTPLAEIARPFDSVSACLSKGLGAPAGTVLTGAKDFVAKARRVRKMLGGGMRQAGILAACGLYAIEHTLPRLEEDHHKARMLVEGLRGLDGLVVIPGDTNMMFLQPDERHRAALVQHLAGEGIRLGSPGERIRVVMHLDVAVEDVARIVDAIRRYYGATA